MPLFERIASALFGLVFVGLSIAVAVETIVRKVFNVSLQGVDELGGYCLAVGGALACAVALAARAHIRIDIVHEHLPRLARVLLNALSVLALAATAAALAWMAWIALRDSIDFQSTAQTPWATPLRYPQSLWVGALGAFLLVALAQLARLVRLALAGRLERLDREFSPRGSKEELEEELEDLRARGAVPTGGSVAP